MQQWAGVALNSKYASKHLHLELFIQFPPFEMKNMHLSFAAFSVLWQFVFPLNSCCCYWWRGWVIMCLLVEKRDESYEVMWKEKAIKQHLKFVTTAVEMTKASCGRAKVYETLFRQWHRRVMTQNNCTFKCSHITTVVLPAPTPLTTIILFNTSDHLQPLVWLKACLKWLLHHVLALIILSVTVSVFHFHLVMQNPYFLVAPGTPWKHTWLLSCQTPSIMMLNTLGPKRHYIL